MDVTIFEVFPQLSINGLWIGMLVFLIVQVAKYADFIKAMPGETEDIKQIRLALVVALLSGFAWAAIVFDTMETGWSIAVVIGALYQMLVGALAATLFYKIVFKPIMERLSVPQKFYRVPEDKE